MAKQVLKISELRLGDAVQLFEGAFVYAVVTQIKDGNVRLFRPYAMTSDFSTTAGVVPYVSFEPVVIHVYNHLGKAGLKRRGKGPEPFR